MCIDYEVHYHDTKTNVSYKLIIDNLMNRSEYSISIGLNTHALMKCSKWSPLNC